MGAVVGNVEGATGLCGREFKVRAGGVAALSVGTCRGAELKRLFVPARG